MFSYNFSEDMMYTGNYLKLLSYNNIGKRNRTDYITQYHKHINTREHIRSWCHAFKYYNFFRKCIKKKTYKIL